MKADYVKERRDSIDGWDAFVDEVLKALKRQTQSKSEGTSDMAVAQYKDSYMWRWSKVFGRVHFRFSQASPTVLGKWEKYKIQVCFF